ncbi:MAG: hypothetical protein LBS27_03730 [Bifidobacteriaceae bacterium]|nr:hypothetical protein [Bifidobacteriaceae bacterium]
MPGALEDLEGLDAEDQAVGDVAWAALDDVLHRRKTGKALGQRNVSADLTGLYRVRFDAAGRRPERYRLVYQLTDGIVHVWGFGPRLGHAIYRRIASGIPVPPPED